MNTLSIKPQVSGSPDDIQDPPESPCQIVVFGANGDLSRRKLMPALYVLSKNGKLHPDTAIVGVARQEWDRDAFRREMRDSVQEHARGDFDAEVWDEVAERMEFVQGTFEDSSVYTRLKNCCSGVAEHGGPVSRLYYLATPPRYFELIAEHLAQAGLVEDPEGSVWSRLVVEKPFGHDRTSARELNQSLHASFAENQLFRIDHYLGKETVQNLLVFRLGNGFVEPLLNRRFVDHVQITVAETVGVGSRAGYFDKAGIVRDMVQSHLLQLLCMVCMEPPVVFGAKAVRDEKVKVLQSLRPWQPEDAGRTIIRGQYGPGTQSGEPVPGYLEEKNVPSESTTETFLAAKLFVETWRWSGTPFYLRTGKRLPARATEISIVFRRPPLALFMEDGDDWRPPSNVLTLRIQPNEGIAWSFVAKRPGPHVKVESVRMDFDYAESFEQRPAEAYERLLLDAVMGDSTLFTREDEVDLAWGVVDDWLQGIEKVGQPEFYAAGGWGPPGAEDLLARDGRSWINPKG